MKKGEFSSYYLGLLSAVGVLGIIGWIMEFIIETSKMQVTMMSIKIVYLIAYILLSFFTYKIILDKQIRKGFIVFAVLAILLILTGLLSNIFQ